MMKLLPVAFGLGALLLAGCANLHPTPPAVKLQAAQGIALISGLESALKTYRTEEAASANYLVAITSDLKSSNASNKRILGDNQVALVAGGNPQSLAVHSKLKVALDSLATNALSGPTFEDYVRAGQKLVTPPDNFTEETTAAQAALAELTKELPTKVAVAEWKATAKTVADGAKDLKKKVNDAKTPATP
jgi:hypothetical protein